MINKKKTKIGLTTSLPALLKNGADHEFRELIQALLGISTRLVELRELIGELVGLTGPQFSILMAIHDLETRNKLVTVGRLAEHLHVSGTYVTAQSNILEKRKYIKRFDHPKDRRRVVLKLAESGRMTLASVLPMVREINDSLFLHLKRDTFVLLTTQMKTLVKLSDEALLIARRFALARR